MLASKTLATAPRSASISGPNTGLIAALFTTMSQRPKLVDHRPRPRCSATSGSPTEPCTVTTACAERGDARPRSPRARPACGRRRTTPAPAAAHASAIARPMPRVAAGDERDLAVEAQRASPGRSQVEPRAALAPRRGDRVHVALAQDQVLVALDLDLEARCRARTAPCRRPRPCAPSGPTAATSAHTSRRETSAVAGMRMPARDLRSPASFDGTTSSRSATIRIDCLSSPPSDIGRRLAATFDTASALGPAAIFLWTNSCEDGVRGGPAMSRRWNPPPCPSPLLAAFALLARGLRWR